jgi:hypothetical protein
MYIRRKVFSTFIDTETGEERLFSTTEIDGMEVKEFSKADDKRLDNEELARLKFAKKEMKYHKNPKDAEEMREYYTTGKRTKSSIAKNTAKMGGYGALIGTAIKMNRNAVNAAFESSAKEAGKALIKGTPKAAGKALIKGTPKAAAIGGAVGLAAGYGLQKAGQKYVKGELKKNPKAFEKDRDAIDVATGEMSLSKYRKKHGKDYEKEDKK